MTPEQHIYQTYPRHVGAVAAYKAISKAVARLMAGEAGFPKYTKREAQVRLYRAAKAYAESPHGMQADKTLIPHPSTFFNQGRYLDDPGEWQHVQRQMFTPQSAGKPSDAWMSTPPASGSSQSDIDRIRELERIGQEKFDKMIGRIQ